MSAQLEESFANADIDVSYKPGAVTIHENEAQLDQLVKCNPRNTINEMRGKISERVNVVKKVISSLGYSKICAGRQNR